MQRVTGMEPAFETQKPVIVRFRKRRGGQPRVRLTDADDFIQGFSEIRELVETSANG